MQLNRAPNSIWKNPIHFLAFGFGFGAAPFAPGTFGTLAAIPLYLLIADYPLWLYLFINCVAAIVGCYLCDVAAKDTGVHDHPGIVWDEIVGYGVTMIAAPKGWGWIILGFVLFRVFDILKPPPIGWFDRHLKNGIGIMVDDLLAAVPAWFILQAFYRIFLHF